LNNEQEDQVTDSTENQGVQETNQESQNQEQSEQQSSVEGTKSYDVDGQKVDPDELYKRHLDLRKGYTQITQRISALEKTALERAEQSRVTKEVTSDIPEDVRSAVLGIVQPKIDEVLNRLKIDETRKKWDTQFDEVAKTWDGKGGKPRFDPLEDREKVLDFIKTNGDIYNAVDAFEKMHKDEIRDWWVKDALAKKAGTVRTERTSGMTGSANLNRQAKPAKTISEAGNRAFERIKNAITD
jgi:hypothetical protein